MSDLKKIIHIDMDCFFAAIEIRDNPQLKNKPVAIGGATVRGVLSTCNYIARKYGLHSAMPTVQAFKLCPKLILLPTNMTKYKQASKIIHRIFKQYTPLVEMLSLDEAFLDVTNCPYCKGSATLIARAIKNRIKKELNLTASAGVAPNKFLAKVASDWNKPDGLFVITPYQIPNFVKTLPVTQIFGVGKVTAKKLHDLQINTCLDLQRLSLEYLQQKFGKSGIRFYNFCRGIDHRDVKAETIRKSLSIETTLTKDLIDIKAGLKILPSLINKLKNRLNQSGSHQSISSQFIKITFCNFKKTSVEKTSNKINEQLFNELFTTGFLRYQKPFRLLGIGVRFKKN